MSKGRKTIVIILCIFIVLTSLTVYVSGVLRLGLLNPSFYSKFTPVVHAYDSMYESLVSYLLEPIESMDVPEELEGVPEDLIRSAIDKKDFNKKMGETIGGGMGWILYNHEDVEIPIEYFADKLYETIKNDERVINSDTNIKATMDAIVSHRVETYLPDEGYEQNFRGYMHYYLTGGNEESIALVDYLVDDYVYNKYGRTLTIVTALSFALLLVLFALILLVADPKRQSVLRLVKVLAVILAVISGLFTVGLFLAPTIANAIVNLRSYAEFVIYASSLVSTYGLIMFFVTVLLIILAVVFNKAQKKAELKYQNYLKTVES